MSKFKIGDRVRTTQSEEPITGVVKGLERDTEGGEENTYLVLLINDKTGEEETWCDWGLEKIIEPNPEWADIWDKMANE